MRESGCDQEQAVMRAVAAGCLDPGLQAHVESCVNCRDVMQTSKALRRLAGAPTPKLPSASYVWSQSLLHQRRAAQRQVTRVLAVTQAATILVSIIALAGWIIWHRSEVGEGTRSIVNSLSASSSFGLASNSKALMYLGLVLLALNLLLTVRAVVTERKRK